MSKHAAKAAQRKLFDIISQPIEFSVKGQN
jgi:hypothetical protein